MGKTGIPVLEPNQEGEYTFNFILGTSEENPEIRIAPTQEQLDELVKNAMEATLVIYVEEEEIARIDLKN
jgi:citrate synthase